MENDTSGTERASKLKAWRISPTAIAFALVALLLAWQWYDGGNRIGALRDELAQRVRESESDSRDARLAARQAQEAAREAQAKLARRRRPPPSVRPMGYGKGWSRSCSASSSSSSESRTWKAPTRRCSPRRRRFSCART